MDFSNRSVPTQAQSPQTPVPNSGNNNFKPKKSKKDKGFWMRAGIVAMAAAVVILLVALTVLVANGGKSEGSYVDNKKLQAVFLNTGQVYFGNIKSLSNKYFVLTNIYYLQTSNANSGAGASANTNITLVKLGCELHEPYDQMVINSDQVTFWENLQDNGQVAKAVSTFEKQNPNGQKCADQSSSSSTTSGNHVQSATPNSSSSTPSSNSSTTNTNTTNNNAARNNP